MRSAGCNWLERSGGGASLPAMKEFTVVVEREEDGRFSVYVPDLPGCASFGDTKKQALANVREAIACYLEGLTKLGRPQPQRRADIEVVRVRAA